MSTQCFLTHDWGTDDLGRNNHTRVARVNDSLKQRGVATWFDAEQMTGSIRDKMAEGVAHTKTIAVFITKRYLDKVNGQDLIDNCKFELDYAFRLKGSTKIIPVVMEASMRNPATWGWGAGSALLSGLLYVNMSSDDPVVFERAVAELHSQIMTRL